MFKRLDPSNASAISFTFNGVSVSAQDGDTIAAALLSAGHISFRQTPVSGAPRGPFCMMGTCFDCLVDVDGETVQACMVPATQGLTVTSPKPIHKFQSGAT